MDSYNNNDLNELSMTGQRSIIDELEDDVASNVGRITALEGNTVKITGDQDIAGDKTFTDEVYYKTQTLDARFHPSGDYVDITTNQTIGGEKTFTDNIVLETSPANTSQLKITNKFDSSVHHSDIILSSKGSGTSDNGFYMRTDRNSFSDFMLGRYKGADGGSAFKSATLAIDFTNFTDAIGHTYINGETTIQGDLNINDDIYINENKSFLGKNFIVSGGGVSDGGSIGGIFDVNMVNGGMEFNSTGTMGYFSAVTEGNCGTSGLTNLMVGGGSGLQSKVDIDSTGIEFDVNNNSNLSTRFTTGATENMRLTHDGKLGIGTNSPAYKLDVDGNGRINGTLYLSDPRNYITRHSLYGAIINDNTGIILSIDNAEGVSDWKLRVETAKITLYQPTDIIGSLEVDGNVRITGTLMVGDSTDTVRFASFLDSDMTGTKYLTFGRSASAGNQAELGFDYVGDNSDDNRLILGFHSKQVLNIKKSGSVGIGTVSPSEKLEVVGNLKVNIKVKGTNDTLELYGNNSGTDSTGFIELREAKTAIGGSDIELRAGSTTSSTGAVALKIKSDRAILTQKYSLASEGSGGNRTQVKSNSFVSINVSAEKYFRVARLPVSSGSTKDFLELKVVGGLWVSTGTSTNLIEINCIFRNRSGFTYEWSTNGNTNMKQEISVVCYNDSGNVNVYVRMLAGYYLFKYDVDGFDCTIYDSPNTESTAGSLIFDSSNTTTYPPNKLIFCGGVGSEDDFAILSIGGYVNIAGSNTYIQPYGGNVGVGTVSPAEVLHVNGNCLIDGNLTSVVDGSTDGEIGFGSSGTRVKLRFLTTDTSQGGANRIQLWTGNNYGFGIAGGTLKHISGGVHKFYCNSPVGGNGTERGDIGLNDINFGGHDAGITFRLKNSAGTLTFQTDYNLVIYRYSDGVAVWSAGVSSSERKHKHSIEDVVEDKSVEIINQLQPVNYIYNDDKTNKTQIGLIIDDCEDLIPEAIKVLPTADETNDDVSKLLDLDKIVPHLINCVKVLNRKVNQLQAELERLSHSPPYSDV